MERAYDDTEFEDVTAKASRVLKHARLSQTDKRRVLEITAFSYFYLNQRPQSEDLLRDLFVLDPTANVDTRKITPELRLFFEEMRAKYGPKEAPPPDTTLIQATPVEPLGVDQTPPSTLVTTERAPPSFKWYTLLPCGIGHFAQGDSGIGAMFLALEVALIGSSVTFYWLRVGQRLPGERYVDAGQASTFQIVQNVTAFAAIGVGIISIVDSVFFAPTRVWKRQLTPIAMPMQNGMTLGVGGRF